MRYQIMQTPDFQTELLKLEKPTQKKWGRIARTFFKDPLDKSLQPEKITGALIENLYSARLDEKYRFLFQRTPPNTVILLWVGSHDPAYEKARRLKISVESDVIRVIEISVETQLSEKPSPAGPPPSTRPGKLFRKWQDAELRRCGLSEEELKEVRRFDVEDDLTAYEERAPFPAFQKLYDLLHPSRPTPPPLFTLPMPVGQFVGRDNECDILKRWLLFEQVPAVQIAGEPGVGKTTVAEWLYGEARSLGYKPEFMACQEHKQASLDSLLSALAVDTSPAQQKMIRGLAPIADRMRVALQSLAGGPVLLICDDYTTLEARADFDKLIEMALRYPGGLRLVLTVHIPIQSPGKAESAWADMQTVALGRLPLAAFVDLWQTLRPHESRSQAQLKQMWNQLNGNPGRLVRFQPQSVAKPGDSTNVPAGYTEWSQDMLTEPANRLAQQLAVVGTELNIQLITTLFPDSASITVISELVHIGVLRELRPAGTFLMDDRAREYFYHCSDETLASETHLSAAKYLVVQADATVDSALRGSLLSKALQHFDCAGKAHAEISSIAPKAYAILSALGDWGAAQTIAELAIKAARGQLDRKLTIDWVLRFIERQISRERFDVGNHIVEAQRLVDEVDRSSAEWSAVWVPYLSCLLIQQGRLAYRQFTPDYPSARACYSEALSLARQGNQLAIEANCRFRLGQVVRREERWTQAQELFSQALILTKRMEPQPNTVGLTGIMGMRELAFECATHLGVVAASQGRLEQASQFYQLADQIARELGDQLKHEICLSHLGELHAHPQNGRLAEARTLFEEALELARQIHNTRGIRIELTRLIEVQLALHDYTAADSCLGESERFNREADDVVGLAWNNKHRGQLLHAHGDLEGGNRLIHQGIELLQQNHYPEYVGPLQKALVN
jgi:tetratricopeptide (TPR) repeat protein/mRNA-degrading endonuclease RelE of RelBE toxin-antitoxin system